MPTIILRKKLRKFYLCHQNLSKRLKILPQILFGRLPRQTQHNQIRTPQFRLDPFRFRRRILQIIIRLPFVFYINKNTTVINPVPVKTTTWPAALASSSLRAHLSERRSRKSANPIQFREVDVVDPRSIVHRASLANRDFDILGPMSRETVQPGCSIAECHRPLWAIRLVPRPRPLPPADTRQTSRTTQWWLESHATNTRTTITQWIPTTTFWSCYGSRIDSGGFLARWPILVTRSVGTNCC